jgi:predicted enzyme related to lactoylglutathione lyase
MLMRVWDVTLTVSDLQRAVGFYERVLELSKKYEYASYAGFDCGGVEIGLVPGQVPSKQAGLPCVDFLVRDVDEVCSVLRGRGVCFLKEAHDTPWGGRIALFVDPDGNILQLVQIDWPQYFSVCAPK